MSESPECGYRIVQGEDGARLASGQKWLEERT